MAISAWKTAYFLFIIMSPLFFPGIQASAQDGCGQALATSGADGITFRGGYERAGVFDSAVPDNASRMWNLTFDDEIWSSPAYWNRTAYFGSNDGKLHAVDVSRGKEIWNHSRGWPIYSSPVVCQKRVYFGCDDGNLYCINAENGSFVWSFSTGGGVYSSPIVAEGLVFFGSVDGSFYAVNATTHGRKWAFPTGGAIWSSPAYYNGTVFVTSTDGKVYALTASSGHQEWNCTPGAKLGLPFNMEIYSTPAVANGTVYTGFGANGPGGVAAINASTGKMIWTFGIDTPENGSVYSSVAVHSNRLFIQRNLNNSFTNTAGMYLYAISREDTDGNGIISGSKEVFWKFATGEDNGGSSPIVADGKVIVATNNAKKSRMYCLNESTGSVIWSIPINRGTYASPTVAEEKVFLPDRGGFLNVVTTGGLPRMSLEILPDSSTLQSNRIITINFNLSSLGTPLGGATLKISATAGKLSQDIVTTFDDGKQKVKYWAPSTEKNITATITAKATRPGYQDADAKIDILIFGQPASAGNVSAGVNWNQYTIYLGAAGLMVIINAVLLVAAWNLKKKTRQEETEK